MKNKIYLDRDSLLFNEDHGIPHILGAESAQVYKLGLQWFYDDKNFSELPGHNKPIAYKVITADNEKPVGITYDCDRELFYVKRTNSVYTEAAAHYNMTIGNIETDEFISIKVFCPEEIMPRCYKNYVSEYGYPRRHDGRYQGTYPASVINVIRGDYKDFDSDDDYFYGTIHIDDELGPVLRSSYDTDAGTKWLYVQLKFRNIKGCKPLSDIFKTYGGPAKIYKFKNMQAGKYPRIEVYASPLCALGISPENTEMILRSRKSVFQKDGWEGRTYIETTSIFSCDPSVLVLEAANQSAEMLENDVAPIRVPGLTIATGYTEKGSTLQGTPGEERLMWIDGATTRILQTDFRRLKTIWTTAGTPGWTFPGKTMAWLKWMYDEFTNTKCVSDTKCDLTKYKSYADSAEDNFFKIYKSISAAEENLEYNENLEYFVDSFVIEGITRGPKESLDGWEIYNIKAHEMENIQPISPLFTHRYRFPIAMSAAAERIAYTTGVTNVKTHELAAVLEKLFDDGAIIFAYRKHRKGEILILPVDIMSYYRILGPFNIGMYTRLFIEYNRRVMSGLDAYLDAWLGVPRFYNYKVKAPVKISIELNSSGQYFVRTYKQ